MTATAKQAAAAHFDHSAAEYELIKDRLTSRENTLDILNKVALILLSRNCGSFANAMSEGLRLIAGMADIDRMSVFRNSENAGTRCFSQIYRWRKDSNGMVHAWEMLRDIPYSAFSSKYENILASGGCVAGPVSMMPDISIFKKFGCVTVLLVPVFDDGKFWGFALFERLTADMFTERETDVLRSASLMLTNAVIRNEEAETISRINEQAQLMLEAAPYAVTMWDKHFKVIDCSQTAVDTFGFPDKQSLIEGLMDIALEYQPDGRRSLDVLAEAAAAAFEKGRVRLEWTHRHIDGTQIVFDATAVRVKYRGEYALMLYSRDIREEKKMLAGLAARDEMLAEQAHWYRSMLDGVPVPIRVTDADMNLTFTNTTALSVFGGNRNDLIGRHCGILNCDICHTENCSVLRAKQGQNQTFVKIEGRSYKIDTEILHDLGGRTTGYLEIIHDITDVENMARKHADEANEAKSVFLAQMSHEMRTPLSAVIGLSELVLENGGLCEENEVYIDKIYNAGSTLLSIVNDILDISKIEAGRFDILAQEYDVPSLINDTITQNILRIHSKPVRFTLNIDENVPARLYGDDIRVKQIVSNLLSNAFKYTDEGAVELRIDFEREGDSVWTTFRVSDTGVGIRPDDLARVFADYTRFDEQNNRKAGGTGLGLSITKRLAALMDGSVTAESEYGRGSVFTARIRQQAVGHTVIGAEMAEHLRTFSYTTSKRRSGAQLNRVKLPYAHVLVVDDNRTNLDIAQGLMRPYGMDIDCVTSGQAAIDAIRAGGSGAKKYDAVFMDHMMPGMDGVEAVRIIRNEIGTEYARTVPIIALTANAVAGNRERFISQGFNAFVSKPIDIFRLDATIRRWVWDRDKERAAMLEDTRVFVERRSRPDRRVAAERRVADRRKSREPAETGAAADFAQVVEGLDWRRGLELFGSEETYREVLRSYAVNTQPLLASISDVNRENITDYKITVHGIKSSSRGVCAAALGNLAESLEWAAMDNNLAFIARQNPEFIETAGRLIADIEALLDKHPRRLLPLGGERRLLPLGGEPGVIAPVGNVFPNRTVSACTVTPFRTEAVDDIRREKPDADALARLRAACEGYDMDGIEAAMREIEAYEYTGDGGLVAWLRDNVTRLNYEAVAERIQT